MHAALHAANVLSFLRLQHQPPDDHRYLRTHVWQPRTAQLAAHAVDLFYADAIVSAGAVPSSSPHRPSHGVRSALVFDADGADPRAADLAASAGAPLLTTLGDQPHPPRVSRPRLHPAAQRPGAGRRGVAPRFVARLIPWYPHLSCSPRRMFCSAGSSSSNHGARPQIWNLANGGARTCRAAATARCEASRPAWRRRRPRGAPGHALRRRSAVHQPRRQGPPSGRRGPAGIATATCAIVDPLGRDHAHASEQAARARMRLDAACCTPRCSPLASRGVEGHGRRVPARRLLQPTGTRRSMLGAASRRSTTRPRSSPPTAASSPPAQPRPRPTSFGSSSSATILFTGPRRPARPSPATARKLRRDAASATAPGAVRRWREINLAAAAGATTHASNCRAAAPRRAVRGHGARSRHAHLPAPPTSRRRAAWSSRSPRTGSRRSASSADSEEVGPWGRGLTRRRRRS